MLFTDSTYTKHQDIYDQESLRKSGFLYSALQSPIQYCAVTAITCVVRLSPKVKHRILTTLTRDIQCESLLRTRQSVI